MATGTNEEKLKILKKFDNISILKFKLDEHNKLNFADQVSEKLDGLDVLVNNAGITQDNISVRLTE